MYSNDVVLSQVLYDQRVAEAERTLRCPEVRRVAGADSTEYLAPQRTPLRSIEASVGTFMIRFGRRLLDHAEAA